jgi:hypothetical protein
MFLITAQNGNRFEPCGSPHQVFPEHWQGGTHAPDAPVAGEMLRGRTFLSRFRSVMLAAPRMFGRQRTGPLRTWKGPWVFR